MFFLFAYSFATFVHSRVFRFVEIAVPPSVGRKRRAPTAAVGRATGTQDKSAMGSRGARGSQDRSLLFPSLGWVVAGHLGHEPTSIHLGASVPDVMAPIGATRAA